MNNTLAIFILLLISANLFIPNCEDEYAVKLSISELIGSEFGHFCLLYTPSATLRNPMYKFISNNDYYPSHSDNTIPRTKDHLIELIDGRNIIKDPDLNEVHLLFHEMIDSLLFYCQSHSNLEKVADSINIIQSGSISNSIIPNRIKNFRIYQKILQEAYITQKCYDVYEQFVLDCRKDTIIYIDYKEDKDPKLIAFVANKDQFFYTDSIVINNNAMSLRKNPATVPLNWLKPSGNEIFFISTRKVRDRPYFLYYPMQALINR